MGIIEENELYTFSMTDVQYFVLIVYLFDNNMST